MRIGHRRMGTLLAQNREVISFAPAIRRPNLPVEDSRRSRASCSRRRGSVLQYGATLATPLLDVITVIMGTVDRFAPSSGCCDDRVAPRAGPRRPVCGSRDVAFSRVRPPRHRGAFRTVRRDGGDSAEGEGSIWPRRSHPQTARQEVAASVFYWCPFSIRQGARGPAEARHARRVGGVARRPDRRRRSVP